MTESTTTVALLDAAEVAFADYGIESVSLRSIMRDAGANAAAVHYHYGSREALVRAVLDRVLAPLQARRLALLDQLLAGPDFISLSELLAALVRPDLEAVLEIRDRNPDGARLIGTIYSRPSVFVKSLVEEYFAPVAARFMPHLQAVLPDLNRSELMWRVRWCLFGLLGALLSDHGLPIRKHNIDRELARILAATSGALSASPTKEGAN